MLHAIKKTNHQVYVMCVCGCGCACACGCVCGEGGGGLAASTLVQSTRFEGS